MKYSIASVALVMLSAATLSAQNSDPDKLIANGGVTVPGWTGRLDPRPESQGRKITEAKFYPMGKGIHATAGPAIDNPAMSGNRSGRSGSLKVKMTAIRQTSG